MRLRSAVLATALFSMPVVAMAQPVTGLYLQGGAGLSAPQNPKFTPYGAGYGVGQGTLKENYGYNGELAVGYGLGNGFRFEIEGDFIHNSINQLGIPTPTSTRGDLRTWGVMANALYDIDVGSRWVFPYLGVGAGYQWTRMNGIDSFGVGRYFNAGFNNQQGAFAWQAIAGASFPIPGVPGLSLTADYRFMDILGGEKFNGLSSGGGPLTPAVMKMHSQYDHEVVFGVRYAFNTPSPPPPPAPTPVAAPAPAPARSYLVFFDWDKATLTDRARSIIKEAADNSTRVQYTRIEVNGYTDTSGTAKYNQGLSVRRAKAVAGELVRDGVPESAIAIQGFGETHLLVPTGPNVREPQNRRVEIIIR
ncbi:MAG TPA: OmpA family protein [Rhodopila sp.]|nr:OmpA family protein [Rhodopila sp.]